MIANQKNILYLIIGLIAVAVLILAVFFGLRTRPARPITLEFWSVFDDSDIYRDLIRDFNKEFPYININYHKKTIGNYENELINALAVDRGPDIFSIHNTWLPKHQDKLSPLPADLMSLKDYQSIFVDVAVNDFVAEDFFEENRYQEARPRFIWALPFYIDTLALYYNKDFFNTAGIAQPPQTWEDFMIDVLKLTQRDNQGNITRSGAALGTAKNINRSTDILGLLMLQNGAQMVDETKTRAVFDQSISLKGERYAAGQEALRFYTDFADSRQAVYTWNREMNYSIDAFYAGETAMMFNYSYHIPTIRAKSPYLNFAVAPMPQIKDAPVAINYANYWAQAVSRKSPNALYAWQFLVWMSEKENLSEYNQLKISVASRRDLITEQKGDPTLGVFAQQALTARSWHQKDSLAIEAIMADMIESVVLGQAALVQAIQTAVNQITVLMRR